LRTWVSCTGETAGSCPKPPEWHMDGCTIGAQTAKLVEGLRRCKPGPSASAKLTSRPVSSSVDQGRTARAIASRASCSARAVRQPCGAHLGQSKRNIPTIETFVLVAPLLAPAQAKPHGGNFPPPCFPQRHTISGVASRAAGHGSSWPNGRGRDTSLVAGGGRCRTATTNNCHNRRIDSARQRSTRRLSYPRA
jgi:hypothetical protein